MNSVCHINLKNICNLSKPAVLIVANMAKIMDNKNRAYVTVKELSELTGYSERSVKRAMAELKEKDVISKLESVYSISEECVKL